MRNWTTDQSTAIGTRAADLLVSASAGSGKTTVMIERIAAMIENGEATPSEILVLTFTKESARDMKLRLMRRLGDKYDMSTASIGTFHKFCNDLVQTYFGVLGINPSFAVMDEGNIKILQDEILDNVIDKKFLECTDAVDAFCTATGTKNLRDIIISTSHFLDTRDNANKWLEENAFAAYTQDLSKNIAMQGIITHYKAAGEYYKKQFAPDTDCFAWSIRLATVKNYDDLHSIAISFEKLKAMKKDCPEYVAKDGLNKLLKKIKEQYILPGNIMVENQSADRELVRQVVELVKEYIDGYARAKTERNFVDFSDLEKYALEILADTHVNERVREKYKFIFVDEYQDTNPVQEKIMAKVAGNRNIFAVGDVKQSIYGFRGTEAAIFTDRMKTYQQNEMQSRVINLNSNFRSKPQILAFVNSVFEKIMRETTAGIDYNATSRFDVPENVQPDECVEVIAIEKGGVREEAGIIAEKISQRMKQGVPANKIAVLARNSTHFDTLLDVFALAGIKCITDKKQKAFELYEIALLNNVLLAVWDTSYELPAALIMQSFVFGFTSNDLAQIKLSKTGEFDTKIGKKTQEFKAFQYKYHAFCEQKSVVDVLNIFIAEYNIIDKLLVTPGGSVRLQNIYNFLNKLRGASYAGTVAQYLYMLERGLIDIEIESANGGEDCVRIMTIHSSKGLEFDTVFLYDAGAGFSSADKRKSLIVDKTCGMCVYSTDPEEFTKQVSIARLGAVILADKVQIAEEMRLLYVALTRAQNCLVITASGTIPTDTKFEPDDFEILSARNYLQLMWPAVCNSPCLEILSADDIEMIEPRMEQRVLATKPNNKLAQQFREIFDKEYAYKMATMVSQKASVTSLTQSEQDFIDMMPRVVGFTKDRGAQYGTKFHKAMQSGNLFDDKTKKCAEVVDIFVQGMQVYKELMFLQSVERDGEQVLVQGVIDLLAIGENCVLIIDYKTTNATKQHLVEIYKDQLDMYADAVKNALGVDEVEKYIYSTRHECMIAL